MNTLTKWSAAIILSGAGMIACTDLGDLENRVNDLESRIEALESQLPALNATLEALGGIVQDGAVITSIDYNEEEGQYEFTLSGDDKTYTLKNGSVGNVPTIGINDDGNWTVTVNGTTTVLTLGEGGEPASAKAVVPQFKIDEDGYWTVSTDGETYNRVTDPDGNPVPATGTSGSDIFDDVKLENGVLKIWLAGETEPIEVKVVSADEFSCVIKYDGQEVDYDTPIEFQPNETLTFEVTMVGVESTIISKPQGWSAELSGTTLTVKAPATVSSAQTATKISANTEKDITIHAISADGLSVFAKMQVELLPGAKPTIEVTVTGDASSYNSVSFTLSNAKNMTSYKYLLYSEGGTVPTELSFSSVEPISATQAPTDPVVLEETADGTPVTYNSTYVLYVMPINNTEDGYTINGDIVSATASTKTATTYSELYEAGEDIVINGKVYNHSTYGDASVIDTETSITSNENAAKIYFVNPDATLTFDTHANTNRGFSQLIIIGNSTNGTRSNIAIKSQVTMNINAGNEEFLIYNMNIDATEIEVNSGASNANYLFVQNSNGQFNYAGIIDCHLSMASGKALTYVSSNNRSYKEFVIKDSEIEIPSVNQLLFFSFGTSTASYGTISLVNNILYSEDGIMDFRLINTNDDNITAGIVEGISLDKLILENNTFVNLWATNNGCVRYSSLATVNVTKNIFWTNKTTANMCFFRPMDTTAGTGIPYTGNPTGTLVDDNYVYKNGGTTNWQFFFGGMNRVNRTGFTACNEILPAESDPLSTADFKNVEFPTTSAFAGYGAQR